MPSESPAKRLEWFLDHAKNRKLENRCENFRTSGKRRVLFKIINHERSELFLGSGTTIKSERALAKINANFAEQIRQSAAIFIFFLVGFFMTKPIPLRYRKRL
jgi:hypothetical protein